MLIPFDPIILPSTLEKSPKHKESFKKEKKKLPKCHLYYGKLYLNIICLTIRNDNSVFLNSKFGMHAYRLHRGPRLHCGLGDNNKLNKLNNNLGDYLCVKGTERLRRSVISLIQLFPNRLVTETLGGEGS